MKYTSLSIQTQREFPNNARTQGYGWLVRAGYMTRENQLLPLGEKAIETLKTRSKEEMFLNSLELPLIANTDETFFESAIGTQEIIYCQSCKYAARREIAQTRKTPFTQEDLLPIEKIATPDTNTIESLANLLNIPKEKTAKALMYTRISDGRFVFIVVRGDMQLSEPKLKALVGDVRMATAEEIISVGAAAGYASPVGLKKEALIVVDDLIQKSSNLVAGANETGFHLLNTNSGRDYTPEIVTDVTLVREGDACTQCGEALSVRRAEILASRGEFFFDEILLALAETHHDDKGLTLPTFASAFDVYLMHVSGKTMDTKAKAEEIYNALQNAGISVLFDDRDERAGVKFNDADLIGCPTRLTVGEKGLQNGMVELKRRTSSENGTVSVDSLLNSKDVNLLISKN
ncbi:MAG: YbaK/EbsC family protein [Anaerolineales bacterium]